MSQVLVCLHGFAGKHFYLTGVLQVTVRVGLKSGTDPLYHLPGTMKNEQISPYALPFKCQLSPVTKYQIHVVTNSS